VRGGLLRYARNDAVTRIRFSGETVIIVGLGPGPHRVLFELADPTQKVICSETVHFIIPARTEVG